MKKNATVLMADLIGYTTTTDVHGGGAGACTVQIISRDFPCLTWSIFMEFYKSQPLNYKSCIMM